MEPQKDEHFVTRMVEGSARREEARVFLPSIQYIYIYIDIYINVSFFKICLK